MSLRGRMRIEKDGSLVGIADDINFVQGANVTLTVSVDETTREASVTIASSGGGGGGGGHTLKEEGAPLTDRAGMNFGAGFDLSDDAGNDETDIALDLSEVAGGGDITWTGNTPAVDNDSHNHTSTTVTTHSTAHAHSDLSGVGANDHHDRSHDHSAAGDSTTLSPATLNLPAAASPAQTADGQAVWDSDDNLLTIGDGASRQTFLPVVDATSDPVAVHSSTAADGTEASAARKDHQHAHGTHTSDLHTNYVQESLHASESFDAGHHVRSHDHSAAGDGTTLSPATLNLPSAASPSQTSEGQAVWDSDDDLLTVGTGAATRTFLPVIDATSDPLAVGSAAADGTEASVARKDHVHAHGTHTTGDLHSNYVQETLIDAAGDLLIGSAADTAARLARGNAGEILESTSTTVAWRVLYLPVTFSKTGTLSTGTGATRWYNDTGRTLTIDTTRGSVGTAPTGQAILVDVNINGTSIWATTQSNRITIADGTNTDQGGTPDTTTITNGQYITVDIDQVGSGTAGADLSVQIYLRG